MLNANFCVYQIYYDQITRESLDPDFLALDNSSNKRPDWYEFYVIRDFLKENKLNGNTWYGFLSPKFKKKTGLTSKQVFDFLNFSETQKSDVAIITHSWDRIAYYKNPFEQGDKIHPGLLDLSQSFLNLQGINVDLNKLITHSYTTVFSNYIIAKPNYWEQWLKIADAFFEFVESDNCELSQQLGAHTSYPSPQKFAPMKTFIQERFPSIILTQSNFSVSNLNLSKASPLFTVLFNENLYTRGLLQTCDLLKQKFTATNDDTFLDAYFLIRSLIQVNF